MPALCAIQLEITFLMEQHSIFRGSLIRRMGFFFLFKRIKFLVKKIIFESTLFYWSIYFRMFSALILTIYLTNGIPSLGRFPINFKSELPTRIGDQRRYFYHVVLGLALGNNYFRTVNSNFIFLPFELLWKPNESIQKQNTSLALG